MVDQNKADGTFDEHKAMLGFSSEAEAKAAYLANYPAGWETQGFAGIKQMSHDEFKSWVRNPAETKKPAANAPEGATTGADEIRPAGKKKGRGYSNKASVTAEIAKRGLNPDDYSIVPTEQKGFIGVRKEGALQAAAPAIRERNAQEEAAPAQQSSQPTAGNEAAGQPTSSRRQDTLPVRGAGLPSGSPFAPPDDLPAPPRDDPQFDEKNKLRQLRNGLRRPASASGAAWTDESVKAVERQIKDLERKIAESQRGQQDEQDPEMRGYEGKAAAREKSPAPAPAKPAADAIFANNTVFTADKVEAARARLRAKLGTLNSGVDPETLIDGMTIAGGYIEGGIRSFRDYAAAMVADLGEGVKPYLLSFYEAVRNYPGVDKEGLTSVADAATEFDALLAPADLETEAVGNVKPAPKRKAKTKEAGGDRTLRADWPVDNIDGWTAMPGVAPQDSDNGITNGVKAEFLKDAKAYLKAVGDALEAKGFTATTTTSARGKVKASPIVSVNEAGPAVSGDVMLHMVAPDGVTGIYATIGAGALRGVVPSNDVGVSIMYRTTEGGSHNSGGNQWARVDLSAADFAETLADHVTRNPWKPAQNAGPLPVRVMVNRLGPDGLTDAERAAGKRPYNDSPVLNGGGERNISAEEKADNQTVPVGAEVDYANDSGVGSRTESRAGSGTGSRNDARAEAPNDQSDPVDLAGQQPQDVRPTEIERRGTPVRGRSGDSDVEADGRAQGERDAGRRRPNASRARNSDDGRRVASADLFAAANEPAAQPVDAPNETPSKPPKAAKEPDKTSPAYAGTSDFIITDPLTIQGDEQVARFNKRFGGLSLGKK